MAFEIVAELAGHIIVGIGRVISYIFVHIFIELIIQGTGYLITKPFRKKSSIEDSISAIVGLLFYIIVIVMIYLTLTQQLL